MWAKFDDQFYLNPKNDLMDRDEQDLYFAGVIYCNGQLTDGFIPTGKLPLLFVWAKFPIEANAQAIAQRLVEHKYWELVDGGWNIHDFLDWNMSKAEYLALKLTRTEAGRRGGKVSVAKRQANAQAKFKQNSSPNPNPNLNRESSTDELPDPTGDLKPLSDSFTSSTKIALYDNEKWCKAFTNMLAAGVTPDEIPITVQKMDAENLTYTGPWSIEKMAISVHSLRAQGKPVFNPPKSNGYRKNGKEPTPPLPEISPEELERQREEFRNAPYLS